MLAREELDEILRRLWEEHQRREYPFGEPITQGESNTSESPVLRGMKALEMALNRIDDLEFALLRIVNAIEYGWLGAANEIARAAIRGRDGKAEHNNTEKSSIESKL